MHSRRLLGAALAALCLSGGLAACGGPSSDDLAARIDQRLANQGDNNGVSIPAQQTEQDQANADARDAAQAKKRRAELAKLDELREAETKKILADPPPGGADEDTTIPSGDAADPAVEKFQAKLTGVCEGGQERIHKITLAAEKAKKAKDAAALLAVAQDYNSALNDFQDALTGLKPPASQAAKYAAWLKTINALSTNIRVEIAAQGDPEEAAKYQAKTEKLGTRLLVQSAELGVTCLSVVS
ncbi:MAG: hypothetical protein AAGC46_06265 [Solirubrobacteraceae bacterium]|nr:hypothetical protein [Patulibacter sp.]